MKIAINGSIIDTKDIYKITEVSDGGWFAGFDIYLFNVKDPIFVSIGGDDDVPYGNRYEYKERIPELEKMREEIIKIWSENQSEIPQFNIQ